MFLSLEVLHQTLLPLRMQIKSSLNSIYRCCAWIWVLFLSLSFIWVLWFGTSGNFILVCGREGMNIAPVVVVFGNVHGAITIFPARLRNNIHRGKGWKMKCQWITKGRVNLMKQWSAVHTHISCKAALIVGHLFPQTWQVLPSSRLLMSFNTCYGYRI